MDPAERELFAAGLRHAMSTASGPALDGALDELGWGEALATDPRLAVSLLFEAQGAAVVTSRALDRVLASALDLDADTAVVLPPLGAWAPPGAAGGDVVRVAGLATAGLAAWPGAAAVTDDAGLVLLDPRALSVRELRGLDPEFGLVEVIGTAERTAVRPLPPGTWEAAVAAGRRAIAHELLGSARAMLELARGHALERVQFDRPIAGFQAVRHRLADALVAIEAAASALDAAWDDPSPFTAALAKALAGRSARTVARHSQQVLAGIGFTAEHPFHRHLRRVLVLDRLLGDACSLTRALGEDLLRTRRLPAILPL